jgi:hypothetical protein
MVNTKAASADINKFFEQGNDLKSRQRMRDLEALSREAQQARSKGEKFDQIKVSVTYNGKKDAFYLNAADVQEYLRSNLALATDDAFKVVSPKNRAILTETGSIAKDTQRNNIDYANVVPLYVGDQSGKVFKDPQDLSKKATYEKIGNYIDTIDNVVDARAAVKEPKAVAAVAARTPAAPPPEQQPAAPPPEYWPIDPRGWGLFN